MTVAELIAKLARIEDKTMTCVVLASESYICAHIDAVTIQVSTPTLQNDTDVAPGDSFVGLLYIEAD